MWSSGSRLRVVDRRCKYRWVSIDIEYRQLSMIYTPFTWLEMLSDELDWVSGYMHVPRFRILVTLICNYITSSVQRRGINSSYFTYLYVKGEGKDFFTTQSDTGEVTSIRSHLTVMIRKLWFEWFDKEKKKKDRKVSWSWSWFDRLISTDNGGKNVTAKNRGREWIQLQKINDEEWSKRRSFQSSLH